MNNKLLANKEFTIFGKWYDPEKTIRERNDVKHCELIDTMSSAGDWAGLFSQTLDNKTYIIPFYQENKNYYFLVQTGDIFIEIDSDYISNLNWQESIDLFLKVYYT